MIEFSSTRLADHQAAQDNEPGLSEAISWLRTHTALRRISHMEVEEVIRQARARGFVITLPEAR